jgi:hypothetical protein
MKTMITLGDMAEGMTMLEVAWWQLPEDAEGVVRHLRPLRRALSRAAEVSRDTALTNIPTLPLCDHGDRAHRGRRRCCHGTDRQ